MSKEITDINDRISLALIEHLGPHALAGDKMTLLEAFARGYKAAGMEAADRIKELEQALAEASKDAENRILAVTEAAGDKPVLWWREGATEAMHNIEFVKPEQGPWVALYRHQGAPQGQPYNQYGTDY